MGTALTVQTYMYTYTYNYMYMGRNYTIYIANSDKFDTVDNKSGLINDLLCTHFDSKPTSKPAKAIKAPAKKPVAKVDELKQAIGAMSVCKKGHLYKGARCMSKDCING